MFLSSYRNTSESLGEREMLWEQEPQVSVSSTFSSSPNFHKCCNFEKWEKHLRREVFPVLTARKTCKEEVSLLERSKPKGTQCKVIGLSMFSEIGKLRARKNFLYSRRRVGSKITTFTVCIIHGCA